MKKTLILLASLLLGGAALAQPSTGGFVIKGNIGYNTVGMAPYTSQELPGLSLTESSAANLWNVSPQIEYFFNDRMSIGLSGSYLSAWTKLKYSSESSTDKGKSGASVFYVGPTYNYYLRLANSFYLSINCFIGYANISTWTSEKYSGAFDNVNEKEKHCGDYGLVTITPTLNYFINDRWLLTASVGNLAAAYGKLPENDSNTYYAGANWGNIMLGVGFKF